MDGSPVHGLDRRQSSSGRPRRTRVGPMVRSHQWRSADQSPAQSYRAQRVPTVVHQPDNRLKPCAVTAILPGRGPSTPSVPRIPPSAQTHRNAYPEKLFRHSQLVPERATGYRDPHTVKVRVVVPKQDSVVPSLWEQVSLLAASGHLERRFRFCRVALPASRTSVLAASAATTARQFR